MSHWLKWHALLMTSALTLLAGCQHDRTRDFDRVKLGMDKAQVLDLLGGPDRSRRWQGKDRWTYLYKTSDADHPKDVHFEEGRVVYSGVPPQVKVSAEEQDQLNEEHNAKADATTRADQDDERAARQDRATKIRNAIKNEDADEATKVVPAYESVQ